ncbi:MAG: hypothetical protein H6555_07915 [Lewinellaceae bacterium]|nr:hypothetical protein [Lewinellaceae bacterium]
MLWLWLLLIGSPVILALIWQLIRDFRYRYACPEDNLLQAYLFKKLPRESQGYRHVVFHLAHCERCRDRLSGPLLEDHLVNNQDDIIPGVENK